MMGLFQEPAPKLSDLRGSEEAPDIPNRILYYLGVVLTDPQVFELVSSLRVGVLLNVQVDIVIVIVIDIDVEL